MNYYFLQNKKSLNVHKIKRNELKYYSEKKMQTMKTLIKTMSLHTKFYIIRNCNK